MIFFLVTPFQIVFVGKSLGEALVQVRRVMLWESTGKVRPLGVCVWGGQVSQKGLHGSVATAVGSPLGVSPLRSFIVGLPETKLTFILILGFGPNDVPLVSWSRAW